MLMQRVLLCWLVAILLLAPLPFGSVQPRATAALVLACLGLGIVWVLWRARRGQSCLPWKDPMLLAGALFALVGVAQTVPLPRRALAVISPAAVDLRDRFEPPAANLAPRPAVPAARPISLYPWATRQSVLKFLACVIAALVAADLVSSGGGLRPIALTLAAAGGFQALYGLAEYFTDDQRIFAYVKKYYTEEATGTFINRNHFAGYLEMTLPFALALAAVALSGLRSRGGTTPAQRFASIPGRSLFSAVGLLLLALTMTIGIVCSRSRMGIASAVLALAGVGLAFGGHGRGRAFAAAAVVVGGAAVLLLGQGGAADPILGRFLSAPNEIRGEVGRPAVWAQVATMAAAFPVAGVGLGAFRHVFGLFRSTGPGVYFDHAHSDYLELASEAGALGCLAAAAGLALVVGATVRAYRRTRRADRGGPFAFAALTGVVAIALHSLTDFNLAIPANAVTFAVLAGAAIAALRSPAIVPVAPPVPPTPRRGRT